MPKLTVWRPIAPVMMCVLCLITACNRTGTPVSSDSNEVIQPRQILAAYPVQDVARKEPLRFQFINEAVGADRVKQPLEPGAVTLTPAVAGKARWEDRRILVFEPDELLAPATEYLVTIDLATAGAGRGHTTLQFNTRPRGIDIELGVMVSSGDAGGRWLSLGGTLHAADFEDGAGIEKIVQAYHDESTLPLTWSHSPDGRLHRFTIENIERKKKQGSLKVVWDASFMAVPLRGEKIFTVPGADVFSLLTATAQTDPQTHVLLTFSDPLDAAQDLTGMVHAEGLNFDLDIRGNQILAMPRGGFTGTMTVLVEAGIRSRAGGALPKSSRTNVTFDEPKPALRFADSGVIVPSEAAPIFPFEAVNLKAVDVRVVCISEKNVPQFLQVNQLNQLREIYRVGKEVLRQKIDLTGNEQINLKTWNRHGLDLTHLVKMEPGALYQITLGFRRSYSLYTCPDSAPEDGDESAIADLAPEQDDSYWNYYQDYSDYNYRDRDNPCKRSYYTGDRLVRRNFLSSNLGLMVKRQPNDDLQVYVTDLNTAQPLANVALAVYDYQHGELAAAKTDANGRASLSNLEKPFLVIAKQGVQRGYLNLNDGYALSMSRFDVGGARAEKGLRGFIYGERGVWRPGDPIHLTFVLQDTEQTLPKDHPVVVKFFDPQNRQISQRVLREGLDGFYGFTLETEEKAPTGVWTARVEVGGAVFSKPLRVETIMPNRLKIRFDLDREQLVMGEEAQAELQSHWLHGAVAKELKADVRVKFVTVATKFDTYGGFSFDDPSRRFDGEERSLAKTQLNADGKATVPIRFNDSFRPPGMLRADFTTRVFEPSGAFSIDSFSAPVHAYRHYVGIKPPKGDAERNMLLTDTDHEISIVTLDHQGKPVSRNNVKVELYKVSWRWWWDQESQSLTAYQGDRLVTSLASGTINTVDGKGTWTMNVKYPEWGRYLLRVTDPDGHRAGRIIYIDWPGWAGRRQEEGSSDAARLTFQADKDAYRVGDDIVLSIPSAQNSRILVSLEAGEKVVDAQWLTGEAGTMTHRFKATAAMAPNVYAHITLIQPRAAQNNDRPMRMYGVIPLMVEDPDTRLKPQITMPDVLEPEQEVVIEVGEQHGRAMTYTLAMVDEGLLDLTRFKTPDPWSSFYARQALLVKTYDQFRSVLGATGVPLTQILAVGGGAGADADKPPKQNRFKPVVFALGPFKVEAGKKQTHRLRLPNYVGSVRTMVVAGQGRAFGSAEKTTPVRKPLMLLASAPRVLGPGERFALPLTVFAMEDDVREVTVTTRIEGDANLEETAAQTLRFTQPGDQTLPLFATVGNQVGAITIKAEAVAGPHRATVEVTVIVRNPNPEIVKTHQAVVEAGGSLTYDFDAVGMRGTNQGVVEVSSVPSLNLGRRLDYLVRYPHGCVEQTTSAAFPQLYLSKLLKLDKEQAEQVDQNIEAGIGRLARYQHNGGGFSYWPGLNAIHDWSTSYVGHFLLEAKRLGYAVPEDMLGKWRTHQTKLANAWQPSKAAEPLEQAYRLYTLALADTPALGAMNRFREQRPKEEVTRYLLAAAYHRAGRPEGADVLVSVQNVAYREYHDTDITLGSLTRDKALVVDARLQMGERAQLVDAIKELSQRLNEPNWLSTQTTAFALMAMSRFAENGMGLRFGLGLGADAGQDLALDKPIYQHLFNPDQAGDGRIHFNNPMETPLWVTTILRGQPLAGSEVDSQSRLSMIVRYENYDGKPVNVARLEQGATFYAKVKVTHPNKGDAMYRHMALTTVFPSGWEINRDPAASLKGNKESGYTYRDVRDDRVNTYFDLKPGETKEFSVLMTAAYLGRFYLPAVTVEAMYDATINASVHGDWVEVVP